MEKTAGPIRSMRMIKNLGFALLFSVWTPTIGISAGISEDQLPLYRHTIAGNMAARQRLRTGVWRASGPFQSHYIRDGKPVDFETEVRLFGAFDTESGRVRFDRDEPQPPARTEAGRRLSKYLRNRGGKYIKTPEFSANLRFGGSSTAVRETSATPRSPALPLATLAPLAVSASPK